LIATTLKRTRTIMAYNATNTEHSGAKNGGSGYYGPRRDAKKDSNKTRRAGDKKAVGAARKEG
jgi:hypothetical protein